MASSTSALGPVSVYSLDPPLLLGGSSPKYPEKLAEKSRRILNEYAAYCMSAIQEFDTRYMHRIIEQTAVLCGMVKTPHPSSHQRDGRTWRISPSPPKYARASSLK